VLNAELAVAIAHDAFNDPAVLAVSGGRAADRRPRVADRVLLAVRV
jgi:hypothetical protein